MGLIFGAGRNIPVCRNKCSSPLLLQLGYLFACCDFICHLCQLYDDAWVLLMPGEQDQ